MRAWILVSAAVLFIAYSLCTFAVPLNVHIVAHTHDDVGWLKNPDQYYYGSNNSIQDARVQYILDTVVEQLQLDPRKRFIYVEIAFFMRWWEDQTIEKQQIVRDLVARRQLEFINGGWVMNDEACVYYPSTINQMTEGHQFLYRNFGTRPTIGWQIDPFGHSQAQATLFADMGFNAFFFARSDYQDYERRNATQELEFIWRSSTSLGAQTDIFTHILFDSTYCNFPLFEWSDTEPVKWDPRLEDYNIDRLSKEFVDNIKSRAVSYKTNNIMISFGCDFAYSDALINYKNMDLLIKYINDRQSTYNMNLFYSTPSIYVEYIHTQAEQEKMSFTLNQYDFFPYRDYSYAVWAGYFASRSAIKGYVRSRNALLHTVTTLMTTAAGTKTDSLTHDHFVAVDTLAKADGVAQHHDSVTGTEKQHVAYDYAKRLSIGSDTADGVMSDLISSLLRTSSSPSSPLTFTSCPLMNQSLCPATAGLSSGQSIPIVVYNPLTTRRVSYLRIPIPVASVQVVDRFGNYIASQVYRNEDGVNVVAFSAVLPPLGFASFVITPYSSNNYMYYKYLPIMKDPETADIILENAFVRATFSQSTGKLSSFVNKKTGVSVAVTQDVMWYNGSAGNNVNSSQASGAYIFRPNGTSPFNLTAGNVPVITLLVDGPIVKEVHQYWTSWAYQVVRLYEGADYLEVQPTIGPIPISDNLGKEVISRYTSTLQNNGTFYTDSNAMEFQQRIRNYRPTYNLNVTEPVALNYFPINTAMYLEDTPPVNRMTVITDRSSGGGSLNDGQFEFFLHRRLLVDDSRGVGEPLNESNIVRSVHWTFFDFSNSSSKTQRSLSLEMNFPAQVYFANKWAGTTANDWFSNYKTDFAPLISESSLPKNVHLVTLRTFETGETLLRLHHIFGVNEDSVFSKSVVVDLGNIFKDLQIVRIREMALTAVEPIESVKRYSWIIKGEEELHESPFTKISEQRNVVSLDSPLVELKPMEIRTFLIQFMHA